MWLRRQLTYANVTATLALFVALSGTAFAVLRVGSDDVVDNSLRSRDVRNDSLRSKDIRNQTVRGRDIRQNALGGREIREASLARVPAAANADRVAGVTAEDLRVQCPADTRLVTGVCIETATRAAAGFLEAISICNSNGRGLPTMAQLDPIARIPGVSAEGEWTSNVYLEPPDTNPTFERVEALIIRGNASVDHARVNAPNPHPFRCVALPSN